MVEVPTPELLLELLLLLPAVCDGGEEADGVAATMTRLVTTCPAGFVVTRAEVIVVGLDVAPFVGLLLLVEMAEVVDDSCCGVVDCCVGVEDCWGCALEAGVALVAACCEVAACVGVVDAAAAGVVFAATEPEEA